MRAAARLSPLAFRPSPAMMAAPGASKNILKSVFINGKWKSAPNSTANLFPVVDPSTEEAFAMIELGTPADVDDAVIAARQAFPSWSATPVKDRLALFEKLMEIYERRYKEMAQAISREMGCPITLSERAQARAGLMHIQTTIDILRSFRFEHDLHPGTDDGQRILYEPVGVVGLITPWNWPLNQITLKVIPALGVGCTCVLKPSEIAPVSGILFAEFMEEAGFPVGVFNMIVGDGLEVGRAISSHSDIDAVSFTGSTRAGTDVAARAAATVKRVSLELGGKSPNLIFGDFPDDAALTKAVSRSVKQIFMNSGQSCNAPTRMLVESSCYDRVIQIAKEIADQTATGSPSSQGDHLGPVVSALQFEKIQALISKGMEEGARLVAGGLGRPNGVDRGYYIRPTVFADANNSMTIAREEIFGPVLTIMPFKDEEEAVAIANDTPYGLSAYVQTGSIERAHRLARRLRAGQVCINGKPPAPDSPFGGYKASGLGRESGEFGIMEFLEVKNVAGWSSSKL